MVVKQAAQRAPEKRIYLRFDKAFVVTISSELFGECQAVARNVGEGGMFVELIEPPPLGSAVTVRFSLPGTDHTVTAAAEVKHHYCLNVGTAQGPSAARGIGLRFVEFPEDYQHQLRSSFTRAALH